MTNSKVSIIDCDPYSDYEAIKSSVKEAISLIGGIDDVIEPGDIVLINPSWVAPPVEKEKGCITIPEIPRAIADIILEKNAVPIIAESSAVGVSTAQIISNSGYSKLKDLNYSVVDLKKSKIVDMPVENWRVFENLPCWELVQKVDKIISVPKLKTHDQTEMTCSIKKLKGLLSDDGKKAMHQEGLFDGVIDLLSVVKPCLAIVDATVCQEGIGPIFGDPVNMNLVLASKDLVATDATCARLIGYDPQETLLTVKGFERGFGEIEEEKIDILGRDLKEVQRRFTRAIEAMQWIEDITDCTIMHGEAACTGCRNTVMSSLVDMKTANQLEFLEGVTICTGGIELPKDTPEENIVTVGKCMKENKTERHVKGCPPNNALVVKAIIAGRAEVKRMYSDKGLNDTD